MWTKLHVVLGSRKPPIALYSVILPALRRWDFPNPSTSMQSFCQLPDNVYLSPSKSQGAGHAAGQEDCGWGHRNRGRPCFWHYVCAPHLSEAAGDAGTAIWKQGGLGASYMTELGWKVDLGHTQAERVEWPVSLRESSNRWASWVSLGPWRNKHKEETRYARDLLGFGGKVGNIFTI